MWGYMCKLEVGVNKDEIKGHGVLRFPRIFLLIFLLQLINHSIYTLYPKYKYILYVLVFNFFLLKFKIENFCLSYAINNDCYKCYLGCTCNFNLISQTALVLLVPHFISLQ